MEKNLCLECPVRGKCCYLNIYVGGFNIMLDNVPCPQLDTETGLCKNYENRLTYEWCLEGEAMYNQGSLPEKCLYVQEDPSREAKPKQDVVEFLEKHPKKKLQQLIVSNYNFFNNLTFEQFMPYIKKRGEI